MNTRDIVNKLVSTGTDLTNQYNNGVKSDNSQSATMSTLESASFFYQDCLDTMSKLNFLLPGCMQLAGYEVKGEQSYTTTDVDLVQDLMEMFTMCSQDEEGIGFSYTLSNGMVLSIRFVNNTIQCYNGSEWVSFVTLADDVVNATPNAVVARIKQGLFDGLTTIDLSKVVSADGITLSISEIAGDVSDCIATQDIISTFLQATIQNSEVKISDLMSLLSNYANISSQKVLSVIDSLKSSLGTSFDVNGIIRFMKTVSGSLTNATYSDATKRISFVDNDYHVSTWSPTVFWNIVSSVAGAIGQALVVAGSVISKVVGGVLMVGGTLVNLVDKADSTLSECTFNEGSGFRCLSKPLAQLSNQNLLHLFPAAICSEIMDTVNSFGMAKVKGYGVDVIVWADQDNAGKYCCEYFVCTTISGNSYDQHPTMDLGTVHVAPFQFFRDSSDIYNPLNVIYKCTPVSSEGEAIIIPDVYWRAKPFAISSGALESPSTSSGIAQALYWTADLTVQYPGTSFSHTIRDFYARARVTEVLANIFNVWYFSELNSNASTASFYVNSVFPATIDRGYFANVAELGSWVNCIASRAYDVNHADGLWNQPYPAGALSWSDIINKVMPCLALPFGDSTSTDHFFTNPHVKTLLFANSMVVPVIADDREKSYIVPPNYSSGTIWFALLATITIITSVVVTTVVIKSILRKKTLNIFNKSMLELEKAKQTYNNDPTQATSNAYLKAWRKSNFYAKTFGYGTVSMTNGWVNEVSTSDAASSQATTGAISNIKTTLDSLGVDTSGTVVSMLSAVTGVSTDTLSNLIQNQSSGTETVIQDSIASLGKLIKA